MIAHELARHESRSWKLDSWQLEADSEERDVTARHGAGGARARASRERARALILAGLVRVNGEVVSKAGTPVAPDANVTLIEPDHPYVGRGGVKLAHALDVFGIDVTGRLALDVGASTGGFTDVLLRRGAPRVVALDVGHSQLDWKLRSDPRVVVLERINARTLTADQLPGGRARVRGRDDGRVVHLGAPGAAGDRAAPRCRARISSSWSSRSSRRGARKSARAGSCTTPRCTRASIDEVTAAANALGLTRVAMTESPITGTEGNREFFLHLRHG